MSSTLSHFGHEMYHVHCGTGHWVDAYYKSTVLRRSELLQTCAIAIPYIPVPVWNGRGLVGIPVAIVGVRPRTSAFIEVHLLPETVILPSSGKRPHGRRIASDPEGISSSKRSRITGTLCPPVCGGVDYRVPATETSILAENSKQGGTRTSSLSCGRYR